jgi:hypothetical protein
MEALLRMQISSLRGAGRSQFVIFNGSIGGF